MKLSITKKTHLLVCDSWYHRMRNTSISMTSTTDSLYIIISLCKALRGHRGQFSARHYPLAPLPPPEKDDDGLALCRYVTCCMPKPAGIWCRQDERAVSPISDGLIPWNAFLMNRQSRVDDSEHHNGRYLYAQIDLYNIVLLLYRCIHHCWT